MKKSLKRCLVVLLSAVFLLSSASAAFAANPPVPGSSVAVCTNAGTTIREILKKLDMPNGWVTQGANSDTKLPDNEVVATGMIAHDDGRDTPIAVIGDVIGTGKICLTQLVALAQSFTGLNELVGAFMEAGDLNQNGRIDISDLVMLAAYVITGKMPSVQQPPVPATETMGVANVTRTPLIDPWEAGKNTAAETAAQGANDFAFRLSSTLLENQEDQNANFVCSPYSVWLPLAALVNATDEQAKPQLLEAIGAAGLSDSDVNTAASRMLYGLTGERYNKWFQEDNLPAIEPLKIANAIFVDRTQTVTPEFAKVFASDYLGESISVDFSSPDAADAVNQWCSDNTDGLIPKIIEQFDSSTVAAIANAIYFSDRWDWEFDPDNTKNDVFHAPSGDVTSPFMLRDGDGLQYYEDEVLQAMPLEFTSGGGLAVLLPKDGDAKGLLSSLTDERLNDILHGTQPRSGKLLLPRFDMTSESMDLLDTLNILGVPLLDPENPAITKLLSTADPLYITDALQTAKIKVDEKGTTAAAVTIMAMAEGAYIVPQTEKFEMNCNHPFVFVLYGDTYDGGSQVLFTGIVNEPEIAA